jgi:hypothetical protein
VFLLRPMQDGLELGALVGRQRPCPHLDIGARRDVDPPDRRVVGQPR